VEGTQKDGKDMRRVKEGKKTTCRCQWFGNIAKRRDITPCNGREVGREEFRKIAMLRGMRATKIQEISNG